MVLIIINGQNMIKYYSNKYYSNKYYSNKYYYILYNNIYVKSISFFDILGNINITN